MLVCPQCQFENPNNHRFCQKCGTSLVDKPCPQCKTSISFTSEVCSNCGAETGIRWRVMIAQPQIKDSPDASQLEQLTPHYAPYLDVGQRYRLLSTDTNLSLIPVMKVGDYHFYEGKVVDCQPLQKSVLEVFLRQGREFFMGEDNTIEEEKEDKDGLWYQIGIPKLALPYLKLRELIPVIPEIHDAWQEDNLDYLLISDRPPQSCLADVITNTHLSFPQIIDGLIQTASLWLELSPLECSQSLLIEQNLGLDEDQMVILGQLYPDASENPPNFSDFAKLWQKWLASSPSTLNNSLNLLLEEAAAGSLLDAREFRFKLQELAEEQYKTDEYEKLPGEALDLEDLPEILREQLAEAEASLPPITVTESDDNAITSGPQMILTGIGEGDDGPTAVLPMKLLSINDAGFTDTGRQRRHNEDFFGMTTEIHQQQTNHGRKLQVRGLYVVCDGMGGHAAGEVASAMAVETLTDYFQTHWQEALPSQEIVQEGIFLANQTLYNVNQQNASSGSGRMGTTLVLALLQDTDVVIAHVGDSRIYRINRKWGLEQLTVDHEVGQRAIQSGIEPDIAYARPDAYQLTQALGPHDNHYIRPDIRYLHIQEDTLFLLCSDGLSDNNLIEDHWESHLQPLISASQNLEMGLQKLITLGNQKNGHDNITAILVRIKVRPDIGTDDW